MFILSGAILMPRPAEETIFHLFCFFFKTSSNTFFLTKKDLKP